MRSSIQVPFASRAAGRRSVLRLPVEQLRTDRVVLVHRRRRVVFVVLIQGHEERIRGSGRAPGHALSVLDILSEFQRPVLQGGQHLFTPIGRVREQRNVLQACAEALGGVGVGELLNPSAEDRLQRREPFDQPGLPNVPGPRIPGGTVDRLYVVPGPLQVGLQLGLGVPGDVPDQLGAVEPQLRLDVVQHHLPRHPIPYDLRARRQVRDIILDCLFQLLAAIAGERPVAQIEAELSPLLAEGMTVSTTLPSARRSPRPNCWRKIVALCVGRSNRMVSTCGRSRPSLKRSTAKMRLIPRVRSRSSAAARSASSVLPSTATEAMPARLKTAAM
jgi:hypothetical protein